MSTQQQMNPPTEQHYELFLRKFARERSKIFRYIFSLLPNHADAEDVFQRCSLVLWQKFSSFDHSRSFFSWACGIALNEVRHFSRVHHSRRLLFDTELIAEISEVHIEEIEQSNSILAHVTDCILRLSYRDRNLIRKAYGHSTTIKSFAESSGSSPQTIYNNLARIRRLIQECVRQKLVTE